MQHAVPQCSMELSASAKPAVNLGPAKPPAMIATRLLCRRLRPLFTEDQWQEIVGRLDFSRRETEIVRLVFAGVSDREIADELAISVNTVQTHLKRLFIKLGVVNRVGLVLEIVRQHPALSPNAEHDAAILPLPTAARRAA